MAFAQEQRLLTSYSGDRVYVAPETEKMAERAALSLRPIVPIPVQHPTYPHCTWMFMDLRGNISHIDSF